jgi:hypothetical protein
MALHCYLSLISIKYKNQLEVRKIEQIHDSNIIELTLFWKLNLFFIKGAQVWDFRPIFFYTNKSYMGRWLEDWRKKNFFWKTTADIRHFVFFTQAEPALKICLRRLSLR